MILMVGILVWPSLGFAATATTQTSLPRDNVKGGAIAARRPGVTISKAISTTVTRNKKAVLEWGGATYTTATPTKKETLTNTFFSSLFTVLNGLVQQLTLAMQSGTST